ncbi:MAG: right-handed parallel beta-helix repeat-containing protein [Candidatus Heimdallarchaeota archaeon]|nr:right-handed parallel beta-helix repeat-containing protein [Candidatus Heimdallarchaeota archaeon]
MRIEIKFSILVSILIVSGLTLGLILAPKGRAIIDIQKNSDFSRYTGEGTLENPYIIESLTINTRRSYGIKIENVSVCFEIRNCDIKADWGAITLKDITSPYCRIVNSKFSAYEWGFNVEEVQCITIENCDIQGTQFGLILNAKNISVSNNFISGQFYDSIEVSGTQYGSIFNNTIEAGSAPGIEIWGCSLNISFNQFINSAIVIEKLKWEGNNFQAKLNISYNKFTNSNPAYFGMGGIVFGDYLVLDDLQESIFEDNTLDNRTIILLTHKSDRVFLDTEIGQLTLIKCNNISFESMNYTGLNQDAQEIDYFELKILQSSLIRINDSYFSNFYQIYFDSCQNISITYCYFEEVGLRTIAFMETTYSTVHHNSFMDITSASDNLGSENLWYDENLSQGNYWIHYTGYPTAYTIPGSTGSVDLFPLSSPPV